LQSPKETIGTEIRDNESPMAEPSPGQNSPYNFKSTKTNKYVTIYKDQKALQTIFDHLPSPLKKEDLKPIKVELIKLTEFISNRSHSKNSDHLGNKTQEGFYKPLDSIIASEYENVSDYARLHRESANAHVEPFNLPGGVYNNGRRILF
jgi:hypothetical protein